jgi:hypothetical protein
VPRHSVTDLIARGQGTGLPVLATTTSAQVAVDLADLVNVIVAYRMDDAAAARRLAAVAGPLAPADPGRPPDLGTDANPGANSGANPGPGPEAAAVDLSTLRDGEFLLAVKNPRRLVPRGLLVRARVPQIARDGTPAVTPRRAWEGA